MAEGFNKPQGLSFDGNVSENWRRFKQQFLVYLTAANLDEKSGKTKTCILLNLAGSEALEIYNTFQYSRDEKDDDIEVVMKKFEDYCSPRKNITYERHIFNSRNQGENESIDLYVTDLRLKARTCEFGPLTDELIRDKIVCGIKSDQVRGRLLREPDLSLQRAIDICRASEVSQVQLKSLGSNESKFEVDIIDKSRRNSASDGRGYGKVSKQTSARKPQFYTNQKQQEFVNSQCGNCGRSHQKGHCPATGKRCNFCHKLSHFEIVCRQKQKEIYATEPETDLFIGTLDVQELKSNSETRKFPVHEIDRITVEEEEWNVELEFGEKKIKFKIDTGAKCNVIPLNIYKSLKLRNHMICPSDIKLLSYSGDKIDTCGEILLECKFKNVTQKIFCYVVDKPVVPILGLQTSIKLNLIKKVNSLLTQGDILSKFEDLFIGLGKLPGKYHIQVDPTKQPVVEAPRRVPLALRAQVKEELDRMKSLGVITPVSKPTDWVSSMVTVVKPGKLRICIDPRYLNSAIKREHYPMPTIEEVLTRLPQAKVFSKFDASSGFWQVQLDEQSSELTTFNTPFGRYKFNRLPFGISSAPEVFQKAINQVFQGLDGVEVIVDDILVWGENDQQHDQRVLAMLERARAANLKLKKDKCEIRASALTYIGHQLTPDGIKPDPQKIRAIKEMPEPLDKKGVQRFLGMVQYMAKFIPDLSTIAAPLRQLTKNDSEWSWQPEHKAAFEKLKNSLTEEPVLKYYDVIKPITLSVDSSSTGLGAVLLQDNQPVAYASRALTPTQTRYAQIEKELLAIVFGCEKFHDYIYGRQVNVETDHKPLETIFHKPLHQSPLRLQKMLMKLMRYDLKVQYKTGKELFIADTLSRAYLSETGNELDDLEVAAVLPMSEDKLTKLQEATANDTVLQNLTSFVLNGWPEYYSQCPDELRPYWHFKEQISIYDKVLFKGEKVIVPQSMKSEMLAAIHQSHLSAEACKKRAREILFWPGLCQEIQDTVDKCGVCNSMKRHQHKEPLMPRKVPNRPWEMVGTDIFEFESQNYLVTVDYYSGFFELDYLSSTKSTSVITRLKSQFARHGIPDELISDNGPQFSSSEFVNFTRTWGFKHTTSSPHYPQSNGMSERAVQTAKSILHKAKLDHQDPYLALLNYQNTPRDTVLGSPTQRFFSRRTKTILPTTEELLLQKIVDPAQVKARLQDLKQQQKTYYDKGSVPLQPLKEGDVVRMKTTRGFQHQAVVKSDAGQPRSYVVNRDGVLYRRNRRDLLKVDEQPEFIPDQDPTNVAIETTCSRDNITSQQSEQHGPLQYDTNSSRESTQHKAIRQSGRVIRKPTYLKDYILQ